MRGGGFASLVKRRSSGGRAEVNWLSVVHGLIVRLQDDSSILDSMEGVLGTVHQANVTLTEVSVSFYEMEIFFVSQRRGEIS